MERGSWCDTTDHNTGGVSPPWPSRSAIRTLAMLHLWHVRRAIGRLTNGTNVPTWTIPKIPHLCAAVATTEKSTTGKKWLNLRIFLMKILVISKKKLSEHYVGILFRVF